MEKSNSTIISYSLRTLIPKTGLGQGVLTQHELITIGFSRRSHINVSYHTYLRAHTAGSVISSRSPAAMMVPTRASIPPNWQTTILFFWLLQVRFDKIPAEQVTMLTSLLPRRPTKPLKSVWKKNINCARLHTIKA